MENELAQQPNLDQDQHNQWLQSRTPEQLDRLAVRVKDWMRSKDRNEQNSSKEELKKP